MLNFQRVTIIKCASPSGVTEPGRWWQTPPRLPKQWSTAHENAWEWLWSTVARNLRESTMKAGLDLCFWLEISWNFFGSLFSMSLMIVDVP